MIDVLSIVLILLNSNKYEIRLSKVEFSRWNPVRKGVSVCLNSGFGFLRGRILHVNVLLVLTVYIIQNHNVTYCSVFFWFCSWMFKLTEWAHFSSYEVGLRSGSSASHILVIFSTHPFTNSYLLLQKEILWVYGIGSPSKPC